MALRRTLKRRAILVIGVALFIGDILTFGFWLAKELRRGW